MTYTNLMVHLELEHSNSQLLQFVGELAQRFRAGVLGVVGWPRVRFAGESGFFSAGSFAQDGTERARELEIAEAQFRETLQGRATSLEWRMATDNDSLSHYLAHEARTVDLIVASVTSGDLFDPSRALNTRDLSDLVMNAGRPLLLVPTVVDRLKLERVVVGWKDTRETRRAISDALPLLKVASEVTVVEIASERGLAAARSHLDDVANWLKLHGVESTSIATSANRDDGTELCAIARDKRADIVVAGAYAHSRLREWAFGGVTRDLLLRADSCTLLSH